MALENIGRQRLGSIPAPAAVDIRAFRQGPGGSQQAATAINAAFEGFQEGQSIQRQNDLAASQQKLQELQIEHKGLELKELKSTQRRAENVREAQEEFGRAASTLKSLQGTQEFTPEGAQALQQPPPPVGQASFAEPEIQPGTGPLAISQQPPGQVAPAAASITAAPTLFDETSATPQQTGLVGAEQRGELSDVEQNAANLLATLRPEQLTALQAIPTEEARGQALSQIALEQATRDPAEAALVDARLKQAEAGVAKSTLEAADAAAERALAAETAAQSTAAFENVSKLTGFDTDEKIELGVDSGELDPVTGGQLRAFNDFVELGGEQTPEAFREFREQRAEAGIKSEGGAAGAAREIKITDTMTTLDLSRSDALNLVDGNVTITTDPVSGRSTMTNKATGEGAPINIPIEITKAATSAALKPGKDATKESKTLFDIAEQSTGLLPFIRSKAQLITGQVGFDVIDPEVTEGMQTFDTAQSDLRRSLRTAPKFLASEMAILSKELDISPGAFKDPQTLIAKMTSIDKSIKQRIGFLEEKIKDPGIPTADRSAAISIRNDLINFSRILGEPPEEGEGADADMGTPPAGLSPAVWEAMPPEDRALFEA